MGEDQSQSSGKGAVITPVKVDRLASWLEGYDEEKKQYLLDGFTHGFRVGYSGKVSSIIFNNHKSADSKPSIIDDYLEVEIKNKRIFGPLPSIPEQYHCAPLGLVPKKNKNDFRIIHDLSFPPGQSVNEFIPPEYTNVQYQSVYDAVYMLSQICNGAVMSKTDIEKAFRLIPVHPDDQYLFCINWRGSFYVDRALQMGCSSSCQIFQAFASAIKWISEAKLQIPTVNYLDDFMLGAATKAIGLNDLQRFLSMCADIGIPMSDKKTFPPENIMTFLGFEIDTVKREIRLPVEKIQQCRDEIDHLLARKKTQLRNLQSVIGLLNFASQVILPGRAFLRRLIDQTRGYRLPTFWIPLKNALLDLKMWKHFLDNHNGRVFFVDANILTNHDVSLYTDASGAKGFGAWFGDRWFYGEWSKWWKEQHIMLLELYPIVVALELWGADLGNKRLMLFTDNLSLVSVLNKQTSKDPLVMILVRRLVLACLKSNVVVFAQHISTSKNKLADLLSRLQIQQFHLLHPTADRDPTPIPQLPESLN